MPMLGALSRQESLSSERSEHAFCAERGPKITRREKAESNVDNKLYVGNLSYSTGDEELRQAFGEFGPLISAQVVIDRDSGQSRGFGFVEFERADAAQRAIDALNGQQLGGRTLSVNVARAKEDRPRGGGGGVGGGGFGRDGGGKGSKRGSRW
jgi:RNA recognition motif-containing protein